MRVLTADGLYRAGQVSVNGKKGKKATQVTPDGKEADPKTPTDKGLKPAKVSISWLSGCEMFKYIVCRLGTDVSVLYFVNTVSLYLV